MITTALFTLSAESDGFRARFNFAEMNYWALAVGLAARWFPRVVLVGDDRARYLLAERLRLPFTEVRPLEDFPAELMWLPCAAKVWGYSALAEEGTPFVAVDGDVFLWRKPADELLAAPAVAQDRRMISAGLARVIALLKDRHPEMPTARRTCCAGLLGGNDAAGLREFAAMSRRLFAERDALRSADPIWHASSACEEALFAAHFEGRIAYALKGGEKADFDRAGMTHLNGSAKADPLRQFQAEVRCRHLFPETARLIDELWWSEVSLQP